MTKFHIKWKVNSQMLPSNPVERMKLLQSMNEMVKTLLDSYESMDWGEYCDGSGGYTICEANEAELYTNLIKSWPYVDFDAKPVLTIKQVIESTNSVIAEMGTK